MGGLHTHVCACVCPYVPNSVPPSPTEARLRALQEQHDHHMEALRGELARERARAEHLVGQLSSMEVGREESYAALQAAHARERTRADRFEAQLRVCPRPPLGGGGQMGFFPFIFGARCRVTPKLSPKWDPLGGWGGGVL